MDFIFDFITAYGLIAAIILIGLEYACFPLPSEIVLPFAGAIAMSNGVNFFIIYIGSIVAGVAGSLVCYAIGRYGGTIILDKIKKKFPSTKKGLDVSQEKFEKYSSLAVCITRLVPLCRTYISIIAGTGKQKLSSFVGYSALGISIWNGILLYLGYKLGENWTIVTEYYDKFKMILIPIVVLLVIGYVIYKWRKKGKDVNLA